MTQTGEATKKTEMPRAAPDGDPLRAYYMRKREALIIELRAIDRLLGRPQTIPEK